MILNDMILLFAEPFEGPFVFSFPSILSPNQNHGQVGFLKPGNYLQFYLWEGIQKKIRFFWDILPKCVYPPTHPRVFVRFGKRKVKFGSKKAIFGVIWGGFEGFGPCLGISHPTHPHLGKISQKKTFFFGSFPN